MFDELHPSCVVLRRWSEPCPAHVAMRDGWLGWRALAKPGSIALIVSSLGVKWFVSCDFYNCSKFKSRFYLNALLAMSFKNSCMMGAVPWKNGHADVETLMYNNHMCNCLYYVCKYTTYANKSPPAFMFLHRCLKFQGVNKSYFLVLYGLIWLAQSTLFISIPDNGVPALFWPPAHHSNKNQVKQGLNAYIYIYMYIHMYLYTIILSVKQI